MPAVKPKKDLRFNFEFVKQGSNVLVDQIENKFKINVLGTEKAYDMDSTVILDVGNCLTKGVIDVHHIQNGFQWKDQRFVSSAKLLTYFPSFLDNIKSGAEEITIIVHIFPDFDCFASAYLAKHYLENGCFPEFAEELAHYAEEIDSGRLKINPNHIFTPYTITQVLSETTHKRENESFEEYQNRYLARGLELIEYILSRFPKLYKSERDFDSPVLFTDHHPFQEEKKWLEADFAKYREDIKTRCEKLSMRLPCKNGSTKEVDGLFWNAPATCLLDRLWARSDSTSPSETGYVFTFVVKKPKVIDQSVLECFDQSVLEKIKLSTHVVISVDGNSDVLLTDLGKMLEEKECLIEDRVLGDQKEHWRTRQKRRFEDSWIDNDDPWYDGRNNENQLVEVPRVGSLLSVDEIKKSTLEYTIPKVKESYNRILYPFQFNIHKFGKLHESLIKNNEFDKVTNFNEDVRRYFRPYIRDYLFYKEDNGDGYSYTFNNQNEMLFNVRIKDRKVSSVEALSKGSKSDKNDLIVKVKSSEISLFRYGIGFVVVETEILSNNENYELPLDLLLEINRDLCEGKLALEVLAYNKGLLSDATITIQDFEEGLLYADIILNHAAYYEAAKKELLYKLCSLNSWTSSFDSESKHMINTLNRMYYDINDRMVMGFSKKGSVLLVFDSDTKHLSQNQLDEYNETVSEERKKFQTWDYYIFLMVLHQRHCLMNFSRELSEIGVKSKMKKVGNLRDVLFEFIMQGWFSQITNDESGMDIHKRWMNVFETQTLHDEVLEQVSTIADHQKSKRDSDFSVKFNIISFFFLIVTGVTGFFGMNIPLTANDSTNEFAIIFTAIFVGAIFVFWLIISGINILVNKRKG